MQRRSAGVDIEAGDRAVELMRSAVAGTRRPEVVGGLGGFAGLFALGARAATGGRCWPPATDGVGTKIDDRPGAGPARHDRPRPGRDGRRRPRGVRRRAAVHDRLHRLRQGGARADRRDRHAASPRAARWPAARLVGGETAEHPAACWSRTSTTSPAPAPAWSRPTTLLGPDRVRPGDAVIALASSGLHSNGYSLVRHVLLTAAGAGLDATSTSSAARSARSCWSPTRIYALDCLALIARRPTCTRSRTSPAAGWPPTWPGAAGDPGRGAGPLHLDPAAGLRPGRAPRHGRQRRAGAHPQHGRRHGRRAPDGPAAVRLLAGRGVPAWVAGEIVAGSGRARADRRRAARCRSTSAAGGPPDQVATYRLTNACQRQSPTDALSAARRASRRLVVLVVDPSLRRPPSLTVDSWTARPPSSRCKAVRSVSCVLYFSARATFCCLALARPRPMARPPRTGQRGGLHEAAPQCGHRRGSRLQPTRHSYHVASRPPGSTA